MQFFLSYPFSQSACFHSSSLILSSFVSFLNRRAVWNLTYPLCQSFNSSRGSVLLISLSILSSGKVHVQFLPFTVGVLSKLYHSYSFLSRFNQSGFNSFLSIKLLICVFATSKVHMVPLVSILYRSALNCIQFRCVLSFNFSTSQGSLVSLFGRRSNLVLPLIFLFLFTTVPS